MNGPVIAAKQVSVNGINTVIRDAGGDTSSAVVFLHGNPGSGADWTQIMQPAAKISRVIAPDMPGFGRSDKPANFNYSVEAYAAHLDALLVQRGIERAHLVLHDFGGPWGLAWASMNPQKVASLTLINIGILPGYRWHYLAKLWRAPLIGEFFMATTTRFGFSMLLKHGNPRGLPESYLDEMYENFDRGTKRAVLKLYRATSELGEAAQMFHDALRPLDLETLVVWGKCDPYISYKFAEKQKLSFPRARVKYMDDSGHWPFIDNPVRFEELVLPHLTRVCGD